MKVKKADFLSAMKQALPGVDKDKSIIEGADTFVFSNNALHSYNDSISVSVPFKLEDGIEGSVKAIDFFKLISKMPTDEITFHCTGGEKEQFNVSSKSVTANMNLIENEITDYISTLNLDKLKWKDLPKEFFDAVRLCKISCNQAPQRGIFVDGKVMYSTDILRINRHKLSVEMDRFWIDDPAVVELLKIEDLTMYAVSEAWVHFKSKDGVVFSCKRKEDSSYPTQQLEDLLKGHRKEDDDIENTLPKGLYNVADRVSVLSSDVEGDPAIQMTIEQDSIIFFSERVSGRIREELPLEKPFKNKVDLEINVDPEFLIEASRKVSKFYIKSIEINEGRKTKNNLIFYNEDYTQIASTIDGEE